LETMAILERLALAMYVESKVTLHVTVLVVIQAELTGWGQSGSSLLTAPNLVVSR